MSDSLKRKTIKGFVWSSLGQFMGQGINFIVLLVIARILDPRDYGLVGMLSIFLAICQSLMDSGFSQALIRKQSRSNIDCSTVFHFNIVVSLILYAILYLIAPYVSDFYHEPLLKDLMRCLCLIIIINSFSIVPGAILTAEINFKIQTKASLAAAVLSGIIAVVLAWRGMGVWTLVIQQIVYSIISVIMLWLFSNWKPELLFSWKSFNELFSFGSKLLAVGLIDTTYNNMYQLVIGKFFTASSLGFYSRAQHFAELPSTNITGIIHKVTYPVLCAIQDDNNRLRGSYRQLLRLSAFFVFPIMCTLAAIAHPMINWIIGDKWDFAATLLTPLCFTLMWYPIHAINLNLLQVKGRSDLFLRLEIIKKIIGLVTLIISIPFGLVFMCYIRILTSIICLFINTYYTGKLIRVGFLLQMKDLSLTLLTSLLVFFTARSSIMLFNSNLNQIVMGLMISILLFVGVSFMFRFDELNYLKSIIKNER